MQDDRPGRLSASNSVPYSSRFERAWHACCSEARFGAKARTWDGIVRIRITRQVSGSIDGIQLRDFVVGFVYDVGTSLGCYLMCERAAEPVSDESPALVTPLRPVQFRLSKPSPDGKVVPMRAPETLRTIAAVGPPTRRRKTRG